MSQFRDQYQTFFTSPAGIELLTWLQEQRTSMHSKAEASPAEAGYHASTAKAYSEILQHIDSVQVGIAKPGRVSEGVTK